MLIQHLYFPKSKDTALYILLNIEYCYYGIHVDIFKMLGKMLPVFQMALFTVIFIFCTFMAGNVEPIF